MATNISLEERMAAVEEAISELWKQVAAPQPTNWLQQITGSFKDDPAFEEIFAYEKAIRAGDESLPKTGAELVDYWERVGVINSRPDILDSQEHARRLRDQAEHRERT